MQKHLSRKDAVIYKRRSAFAGQVCIFEAAITAYTVFDPLKGEEVKERVFLHPYLSVGLSDLKYKKLLLSPDMLPVTGKSGISGLRWGLERVNEIKKFNFPIAIMADMGDPKRLRAYLRLVKHGFMLCPFDYERGKIYYNCHATNYQLTAKEFAGSHCLVYDPYF
jgi:hypothetical protein